MRRIFLLEGYSPLRNVLESMLTDLGFEVTEVRSVADAGRLILETITAPDLAILDCHVSDGKGSDVARMLRERFGSEVRIVGVSMVSEDEWDSEERELCNQIIKKPGTRKELEAIVQPPGSP